MRAHPAPMIKALHKFASRSTNLDIINIKKNPNISEMQILLKKEPVNPGFPFS